MAGKSTPKLDAPDGPQSMSDLLAIQSKVFKEQRARGTVSLQAPCKVIVEAHFASIDNVSTRGSCKNRWGRYSTFCDSVKVPCFPILGPMVALSINDLAEGNPDNGKAYDTHITVLNALRKKTAPTWEGKAGCNDINMGLMEFEPLRSFCFIARTAALRLKNSNKGTTSSSKTSTPQKKQQHKTKSTQSTPAKRPRVSAAAAAAERIAKELEAQEESKGSTPPARGKNWRSMLPSSATSTSTKGSAKRSSGSTTTTSAARKSASSTSSIPSKSTATTTLQVLSPPLHLPLADEGDFSLGWAPPKPKSPGGPSYISTLAAGIPTPIKRSKRSREVEVEVEDHDGAVGIAEHPATGKLEVEDMEEDKGRPTKRKVIAPRKSLRNIAATAAAVAVPQDLAEVGLPPLTPRRTSSRPRKPTTTAAAMTTTLTAVDHEPRTRSTPARRGGGRKSLRTSGGGAKDEESGVAPTAAAAKENGDVVMRDQERKEIPETRTVETQHVERGTGKEELGVFGKITRWFGWGA